MTPSRAPLLNSRPTWYGMWTNTNQAATTHPLQVRAHRLALCPFRLSVSCSSVKELRRLAGWEGWSTF